MADVKLAYAVSANQTVTDLHSLATSSTHLGGWEGPIIDNATLKYTDYRVTLKVTVAAAGLAAGEVRVHFVGMLDDATWPDVFDGTAGAETVTDTEIRDAICRIGAAAVTDTTASRVYYLEVPSLAAVFNGNLPEKCVPFITQSTGAALAATGNQLTIKGTYATVT